MLTCLDDQKYKLPIVYLNCPFTRSNKDFPIELVDNGILNSRAGIVIKFNIKWEIDKLSREKENDQGRLFQKIIG